jgi:diacylglycerol kinase (ATP)
VTSPFGPLVAIAELGAGGGRVHEQLPDLERALKEHDLDFELRRGDSAQEIARLTSDALRSGCRFVVAVGDDRTVQAVVNGMFAQGRPLVQDAVLGVVPAGTGSDLVMCFGLPDDTRGACEHLIGDTTYPFDLMKITYEAPGGERITRYAANVAEVGMGGEMARRTSADRAPATNLRRFTAFWAAFARSKPRAVRVDADTRTWEGRAFNIVIGNGQFTARGMRLSPRSFPGDGVLEGLVFSGPRSDAYRMLPKIYRHGDHVPDPHIVELRAKIRIAVQSDRPLPVAADGVPLGTTPATFQVVPQQIRLKL